MGDSSVSCVLSGISLHGDHAVLIALAPARFSAPNRRRPSFSHGARFVTNEGASGLMAPVLLPIFGRLNGYGALDCVEENDHTRFLEQKLGMPIAQIASRIASGHKIPGLSKAARSIARQEAHSPYRKHTVWDGMPYGCFVSRKIWDEFSTASIDESGQPDWSMWDDGWQGPSVLRSMGFLKQGKDANRAIHALGEDYDGKRHHTLYQHPELPHVEAWCDEHMSTLWTVRGKRLGRDLFRLKDVQASMQRLDPPESLPPSAIQWAQSTSEARVALLNAKHQWMEMLQHAKRLHDLQVEKPESTFRLIEDTSPQDVQEHNRDIAAQRLRSFFERKTAKAGSETSQPDKRRWHAGARHTYCDGRWHVSVTLDGTGAPSDPKITACTQAPTCDRIASIMSHRCVFTPEIFEALKAAGWKLRKERPLLFNVPSLNIFAPEMQRVYGLKMLRQFLPATEALTLFTRNMHAANRLYQPTNTGYQYGHPYLQRKVAEAATRILTERIAGLESDSD